MLTVAFTSFVMIGFTLSGKYPIDVMRFVLLSIVAIDVVKVPAPSAVFVSPL